jgi:excinuclease ABC subunit B
MSKRPDKPSATRHPAKHSKSDPAKPTRAKAARPDLPPTHPTLADLLNPAIGRGRAGVGSQTGQDEPAGRSGLTPPPDNSFDRRADFAKAHTARHSTQRGFREAPQPGYIAKDPVALDPELANALGYGDSDPSRPVAADMPAERDEISDIFAPRRDKRHRPSPQPVMLGVTASMQALYNLLREGRALFD